MNSCWLFFVEALINKLYHLDIFGSKIRVDGLTVLAVMFQLSVGISVAHDGKPKKNQPMGSILVEPVGHTGLPGRSVTAHVRKSKLR
jgi:hypothetical protein